MHNALKSYTPQRLDTEELIELAGFGRLLEAEFNQLSVDAPEWIGNQLKAVRREIKTRNADAIANKLRAARARLATLATPDEKRAAVTEEIAKLEELAKAAGA